MIQIIQRENSEAWRGLEVQSDKGKYSSNEEAMKTVKKQEDVDRGT